MPKKLPANVQELKRTIQVYQSRSETARNARARHTGNMFSGESNDTERRWSGRTEFSTAMLRDATENRVKCAFLGLTRPHSITYWRRRLKKMGIDV